MSGIKTLSVISLGFTLRSSCCVMLFQWHYHRALKKHTKAWSASWLWSVCNSPGVLPDFMVLCVNCCVCAHVLTSWPTLCDPMDYSPTSSSAHGVFQSRMLEEKKKNAGVGCHFLQVIFPTERSSLDLLYFLHWQVDSLPCTTWEAHELCTWYLKK